MKHTIEGGPSFANIHLTLEPGESITTESGAMASMDAGIHHKARMNGGLFGALIRKFLGGETLFINVFTNKTQQAQNIVLTQAKPGNIQSIELNGGGIFLQPGAYICSTPGIKIAIKWAGIRSFIAREGLFRQYITGHGRLWFGAYGHIYEREMDGEFLVDSSHLVAYDPMVKINLQLSGGLISSITSGEGFVTRLAGKGKVFIQSRSLSGLVAWINPKL